MRVLVTGAAGLVGKTVVANCEQHGDEVIAATHQSLDITDQIGINEVFDRERPQLVINCAAWTDVDACESNPERALNVNGRGPERLALASRKHDAPLITISTDYVFDGEKVGFYTQDDEPRPLSNYGRSKLRGEQRALAAWDRTIVVRSGYIFGAGGSNFLSTILARARRGERLRAINDMFGTPTHAPDLANQIRQLAELNVTGIFHLVNRGEGASFADFATAAITAAGLSQDLVEPVSLTALNRPAPRPRNSRLKCLRSESAGLRPLRPFTEALREFVATESAAK